MIFPASSLALCQTHKSKYYLSFSEEMGVIVFKAYNVWCQGNVWLTSSCRKSALLQKASVQMGAAPRVGVRALFCAPSSLVRGSQVFTVWLESCVSSQLLLDKPGLQDFIMSLKTTRRRSHWGSSSPRVYFFPWWPFHQHPPAQNVRLRRGPTQTLCSEVFQ